MVSWNSKIEPIQIKSPFEVTSNQINRRRIVHSVNGKAKLEEGNIGGEKKKTTTQKNIRRGLLKSMRNLP